MRDDTHVSDNGGNLSGGQRQRIALARAAYCRSDIYLMDQPFSALDAHTAKKVYRNLVGQGSMLNSKTRIVATDCQELIADADFVIELENGAVKYFGPGRSPYMSKIKLISSSISNSGDIDNSNVHAPKSTNKVLQIRTQDATDSTMQSDEQLIANKFLYMQEGGIKFLILGVALVFCSVGNNCNQEY